MTEVILKELSYQVISAVFEVHNVLGSGFLEKVYERALVKECNLRNIAVETQKEIKISYKGETIGSILQTFWWTVRLSLNSKRFLPYCQCMKHNF